MLATSFGLQRAPAIPVASKVYNLPSRKQFRKNLRNSLTPAESLLWKSLQRRQLLGRKFRRQAGIGRYIATAVLARDYPAIQGSLLVLVAMVMVMNFVVDVLHHALEPRLRT